MAWTVLGRVAMANSCEQLRREHELIARVVAGLDALTLKRRAGADVPMLPVTGAVDFFAEFVARCHDVKEQQALFPMLVARAGTNGLVEALRHDHEEGDRLLRALRPLSSRQRVDGEAWTLLESYLALLRRHLASEDVDLLPLADRVLSPEDDDFVRPFVEDREARHVGCWAITEPADGSDAFMIDPRVSADVIARRDRDYYVLTGRKAAWVTNGTIATHALVFLGIDPARGMEGGGVALVPLDLRGVSRGKPADMLGQRALNQSDISFDEVRIHESQLLTDPTLYEFMLDRAIASVAALMGAICTEAAADVTGSAVGLFGGEGLVRGCPVGKLFRDARASLTEYGSNDVLALVAARRLLANAARHFTSSTGHGQRMPTL